MAKPIDSKLYPIGHYLKIVLVILITTLVLDVVISFFAIQIVKKQSSGYLEDTASLYIERINHDFDYIRHYMGWTLVNDESVKNMVESGIDSSAFRASNETLYKRFSELQKNYGQQYNFFLYFKNHDFFANSGPMTLTYPAFLELRSQIQSYTGDRSVYQQFYSDWTPILLQSRYYLINIVPFYDRYLIGLISADDLIGPLRQINLGKEGYVTLINRDGDNLVHALPGSDRDQRMQSRSGISKAFSNAAISVKIVIQFGKFEKIMIAQLLIILLFIIVTFTLSFVIVYFNRRVMKPIQSFSKNLALIQDDDRPIAFKNSKIIELEQANSQFKQLIGQVRAIKIDLYEREMEKQKIQLDYMKLQINPHFFLNCLTTIHSMAQMQMFEGIERMAISTSDYFRYMFQQGNDFVRLADEIEHIKVYLQIQQHRYQDSLAYRIELARDVENLSIPPLILQTFIENAVKYAVSRADKVLIELTAERIHLPGEDRAVIRIMDNGPGFPPDILSKLIDEEPLEQTKGSQIGIMNAIQRLELLYSSHATVRFENRHHEGASVTLSLPYLTREEPSGR